MTASSRATTRLWTSKTSSLCATGVFSHLLSKSGVGVSNAPQARGLLAKILWFVYNDLVRLDIEGLSVPTFDQNLFEYLVLPRQIKDTLEALALNNSDGKFSADFIRGKGEGQVFLLHGSPGVGKTCAAGKLFLASSRTRTR